MGKRYSYSRSKSKRELSWEENAERYGFGIGDMVAICSRLESRATPSDIVKRLRLPVRDISTIHQILIDPRILFRGREPEIRNEIRANRREETILKLENLNLKKMENAKKYECAFCNGLFRESVGKTLIRLVNVSGELVYKKSVNCCSLCNRSRQGRTLTQWLASLQAQKRYGTDSYEHYRGIANKTNLNPVDTILQNAYQKTLFKFHFGSRK